MTEYFQKKLLDDDTDYFEWKEINKFCKCPSDPNKYALKWLIFSYFGKNKMEKIDWLVQNFFSSCEIQDLEKFLMGYQVCKDESGIWNLLNFGIHPHRIIAILSRDHKSDLLPNFLILYTDLLNIKHFLTHHSYFVHLDCRRLVISYLPWVDNFNIV